MGTKEALEKAKDIGDLTVLQGVVLREMEWRARRKAVGMSVLVLGKALVEMGLLERSETAVYQVLMRMVRDGIVEQRKERTEEGGLVTRYYATDKGNQLGMRMAFLEDRWRDGVKTHSARTNAPVVAMRANPVASRPAVQNGVSGVRETPEEKEARIAELVRQSQIDEQEEEKPISKLRKLLKMIADGGQADPEEQELVDRVNALAKKLKGLHRLSDDDAKEMAVCQME